MKLIMRFVKIFYNVFNCDVLLIFGNLILIFLILKRSNNM